MCPVCVSVCLCVCACAHVCVDEPGALCTPCGVPILIAFHIVVCSRGQVASALPCSPASSFHRCPCAYPCMPLVTLEFCGRAKPARCLHAHLPTWHLCCSAIGCTRTCLVRLTNTNLCLILYVRFPGRTLVRVLLLMWVQVAQVHYICREEVAGSAARMPDATAGLH